MIFMHKFYSSAPYAYHCTYITHEKDTGQHQNLYIPDAKRNTGTRVGMVRMADAQLRRAIDIVSWSSGLADIGVSG